MAANNRIRSFFIRQKDTIVNEFKSEPPKKLIINTLFVLLGAFLLAVGTELFFVPLNIIAGGVSSLAIIFHSIPVMSAISVENYITIINWAYFFIGLFLLGVKYSMKTLIVTIFYPLFIYLIDFLIDHVVIDGVNILDISKVTTFQIGDMVMSQDSTHVIAYIIAIVLGGIIGGIGVGFALSGGGSSGGTDVQVLLMHKYLHMNMGVASFISDSVFILGGFFINGHAILATLAGILAALVVAISLDKVFANQTHYYLAFIISKRWHEINNYINNEIGRGTTIIQARGGYSSIDTQMIEVCFDAREYAQIEKIINKIDPNAFVTVMTTTQILGYGFSRATPEVAIKDMPLSPDQTERIYLKAKRQMEKDSQKIEKQNTED